ncbi:MAG: metallophosphoesterase [Hominimerdicola sp.]
MVKKLKKKHIITIIVLLFLVVFFWIQNNYLTITYYSYESSKLSEDFDGFRIVQISDLHNKSFGKDSKRLIEKISGLNPDIIVITGDIVDSNHTNIETAVTFAQKATEICPTYYITGNHENWLSDEDKNNVLESLDNVGVTCLENEAVEISKGESSFSLIGLNDESLGDIVLNNIVESLDEKQLQILLAHEPDYFADYCESGVDLVLSGHAHGGQFRLPFLGGLYAPDQGFLPEYTEGEHTDGNTTMIISRGLGNSVIPVRLFNLPEIVCVDLHTNN